MKILLAKECGGHPFWQRNRYNFTLIDTDIESAVEISYHTMLQGREWYGSYEVEFFICSDGVYAQIFHCSSGGGKIPQGERFMVIPRTYDKVIIIPNAEKRKAEQEYEGHWQDNSDFE